MSREDGEYKIINAYEDMVYENVKELMTKQDMCRCEKCYKDICALVFNKGFIRFVTTPQGELFAKLPSMSNKNHVELLVAISEAIEMVRHSPKHEA